MKIEDRYIRDTEARVSNPRNLKVLSDDAYAVCEFIEALMRKLDFATRLL